MSTISNIDIRYTMITTHPSRLYDMTIVWRGVEPCNKTTLEPSNEGSVWLGSHVPNWSQESTAEATLNLVRHMNAHGFGTIISTCKLSRIVFSRHEHSQIQISIPIFDGYTVLPFKSHVGPTLKILQSGSKKKMLMLLRYFFPNFSKSRDNEVLALKMPGSSRVERRHRWNPAWNNGNMLLTCWSHGYLS